MTVGPIDEEPRPTEPAAATNPPAETPPQPPTTPAPPAESAERPAAPPPPVAPEPVVLTRPASVVETLTTTRPAAEAAATPRSIADTVLPSEPVFSPFSLTVGDGFKFGCGFLMALTIASLIGFLVLSLILLVASLVGAPLPIGR